MLRFAAGCFPAWSVTTDVQAALHTSSLFAPSSGRARVCTVTEVRSCLSMSPAQHGVLQGRTSGRTSGPRVSLLCRLSRAGEVTASACAVPAVERRARAALAPATQRDDAVSTATPAGTKDAPISVTLI